MGPSFYQGDRQRFAAPDMVSCVDVGVCHEQWGTGFRVEDNCLVTETGCENRSGAIPRTLAGIQPVMRRQP